MNANIYKLETNKKNNKFYDDGFDFYFMFKKFILCWKFNLFERMRFNRYLVVTCFVLFADFIGFRFIVL